MPFVYITRCADETLYVGRTKDLVSREQTHNDGKGAVYTTARTPIRIVYAEEYASIEKAIARERQLKGWSRKKKEALIVDNAAALIWLAQKPKKSMTLFTWRDLLNRLS